MSVMGSEDVLLANIVCLQTHCALEHFHKNSVCWNINGAVLTLVPSYQADQRYPV